MKRKILFDFVKNVEVVMRLWYNFFIKIIHPDHMNFMGLKYMAVTAIYAAATGGKIAEYALICAVGALISMVGDLAASAIKRNQGIKDYGKLIPGHGGILDRFDSVIFTAPAIYFLAKLVLGI